VRQRVAEHSSSARKKRVDEAYCTRVVAPRLFVMLASRYGFVPPARSRKLIR
jgi:hypothetical protein